MPDPSSAHVSGPAELSVHMDERTFAHPGYAGDLPDMADEWMRGLKEFVGRIGILSPTCRMK